MLLGASKVYSSKAAELETAGGPKPSLSLKVDKCVQFSKSEYNRTEGMLGSTIFSEIRNTRENATR